MGFIMGFLGRSTISFHHSPNPLEIITKTGDKRTLLDICKAATPPCRLNPLLFNGHLQTFWTAVKSKDIPVYYKRKVFKAEDPAFAGSFAVDFVVEPYQETDESLPPRTTYYTDAKFGQIGSLDDRPMLVALHGLSGGSHEIYLRSVLWPVMQEEWEVCVVNSRGCAQSPITSDLLYNARSTWDIRQVVKWLAKTFPNRPLFGVGFSLGANILVNVCTMDTLARKINGENLLIFLLRVVPWGRRFQLPAKSCCSMLQSLEPGRWLNRASTIMVRARGVFENNDIEFESLV
jgi:hypothetical protein